MAKRRSSITEIDVSGGFINERGRHVNTDIPNDERRGGSSGKSGAKKRLQKSKEASEERKAQRKLEEEEKLGVKVKRKKKLKDKAAESEVEVGKKKKRRKRTVGELLETGKTDKAQRKLNRMASKALAIIGNNDVVAAETEVLSGHIMPSGQLSSEAEFLNEYQHIYSTLGSIIRKLEENMTDPEKAVSSKDVYALMTMYSQMRETIADMRSIKDMNEQAEELAREVFDPAAKSAGEALVNVYFKVSSLIRQEVKDPTVVESILARLKTDVADQATKLQEQFVSARSRVLDVMNGGR